MAPHSLCKARLTAGALVAGSAATLVALLAFRPHLAGGPGAWRGDDLALAAIWLVAALYATWLLLTALACSAALVSGQRAIALRIAHVSPPVGRRFLQLALVGASVVVPTAAYAAPASAPPLVVHVGPGGRLVTIPGTSSPAAGSLDDTPVVRAPVPTTTTISSAGPAAPRQPARATPFAPPAAAPASPARAPHPSIGNRPPATIASAPARTYVVRAGDNLWRIAEAEVARTAGTPRPESSLVAPYWRRVIAANRATLRSGDPSLIFPGELVTLPD